MIVSHVLFPSLLYSIGLIPVLVKNRRTPTAFFACTAFAWGALLWVVAFIFCLWLSIPYSPFSVTFIISIVLAVGGLLLRNRFRLPTRSDLKVIMPAAVVFLLVMLIAHFVDGARASPDSLAQLILADELSTGKLARQTLSEFGYWGPMLAALHAPANWFGYAYFTTLQAAFSITMLGSFGYFCYRGLIWLELSVFQASLAATLATFFLLSSPFVFFQFYYIHNNIAATNYLLIGAGTLWAALTTKTRDFHWMGVIALLGFSLTRTESALFAVIFLTVALSSKRLPQRDWLIILLPYTAFLATWQLWLLFVARPTTHILTQERILIILAVILGFYLVIVLDRIPFFRRTIIHNLHQIMMLAFLLATIAMLFIDPANIFLSLWYATINLFTVGLLWWGTVWWIAFAWLLSLRYASSLPQERLFVIGIVGFFMFVMVLGFAHGPGRPGWYSSPNRLFLHILPVILLYLTLKSAPYMLPLADRIHSRADLSDDKSTPSRAEMVIIASNNRYDRI